MRYKSGYKYQITACEIFQTSIKPRTTLTSALGRITLHPDGKLCLSEGFCFDGPSGPIPDFKSYMLAALCHDALYCLMRQSKLDHSYWREADYNYGRLLKAKGAWAITVKIHMLGLKLANGASAHPGNRKKIHEA